EQVYEKAQYRQALEYVHGSTAPLTQQWLPLMIAMLIVSAVVEEIFFRGFLFSALERVMQPLATVLLSALLFGLLHVVMGGPFGTFRFWPSMLMGVFLGLLRLVSGSVWPGMLLHTLHNSLLQCAPLLGFAQTGDMPELWLF